MPSWLRKMRGRKSSNLRRLASAGDWPSFLVHLSAPSASKQVTSYDIAGRTLLHEILEHDPPLEVVRAVIDEWPGALAEGGLAGQFPLHDACLERVDVEIIRLMLNSADGDDSAGRVDEVGRTALHLAVRMACEGRRRSRRPGSWPSIKRGNKLASTERANEVGLSDDSISRTDRTASSVLSTSAGHAEDTSSDHDPALANSLAVISLLCRAAPETINAPDVAGVSPLDITRESNHVVAMLLRDEDARADVDREDDERTRSLGSSFSSLDEESDDADVDVVKSKGAVSRNKSGQSSSAATTTCSGHGSRQRGRRTKKDEERQMRELMELTRRSFKDRSTWGCGNTNDNGGFGYNINSKDSDSTYEEGAVYAAILIPNLAPRPAAA